MRKRQNEMTSSSKNGEYHILGRNSDFREKFGILELEMSHPGYSGIPTLLNFLIFSLNPSPLCQFVVGVDMIHFIDERKSPAAATASKGI